MPKLKMNKLPSIEVATMLCELGIKPEFNWDYSGKGWTFDLPEAENLRNKFRYQPVYQNMTSYHIYRLSGDDWRRPLIKYYSSSDGSYGRINVTPAVFHQLKIEGKLPELTPEMKESLENFKYQKLGHELRKDLDEYRKDLDSQTIKDGYYPNDLDVLTRRKIKIIDKACSYLSEDASVFNPNYKKRVQNCLDYLESKKEILSQRRDSYLMAALKTVSTGGSIYLYRLIKYLMGEPETRGMKIVGLFSKSDEKLSPPLRTVRRKKINKYSYHTQEYYSPDGHQARHR